MDTYIIDWNGTMIRMYLVDHHESYSTIKKKIKKREKKEIGRETYVHIHIQVFRRETLKKIKKKVLQRSYNDRIFKISKNK